MSFAVKILGSNSAAPAHDRHQTAQVLQVENESFLIDCGEGTQLLMKKYGVKPSRIDHILVSHLHGDHYLGLMGLISTQHLQHRQAPLHIYGQKGLDEIITTQLKYSQTNLHYPLHFHILNPEESEVLFETKRITVSSFPLSHRIPCCGFLFKEKPHPIRLNKAMLPEDLIPSQIIKLKNGEDLKDETGKVILKSEEVTLPPKKARSYAYCSDTRYDERLIPFIEKVDLLYHEATFTKDKSDRAAETYHSTAEQAATIAQKAQVAQLLIGHFSTRYKDLTPVLQEAKSVFQPTALVIEGEDYEVAE